MSIFLQKIFKFSVNVFAESSEEGVCSEDIDTGGSIENAGEITVEDSSASFARACLKNHSHNLHAPLCGIFYPNSVAVARYGALIRAKSPTNCDAHLAESLFQTRSSNAEENTIQDTAEQNQSDENSA